MSMIPPLSTWRHLFLQKHRRSLIPFQGKRHIRLRKAEQIDISPRIGILSSRAELMKGHGINSTISKQKRRSHISGQRFADAHLGSYCL